MRFALRASPYLAANCQLAVYLVARPKCLEWRPLVLVAPSASKGVLNAHETGKYQT